MFDASDLLTGKLTDKAPGSEILLRPVTENLKEALLGAQPSGQDFDPKDYKQQLLGDASLTGSRVSDIRAAILAATTGDVRSQLNHELADHLETHNWFNKDGSLRPREQIIAENKQSLAEIDTDVRSILRQLAARTENSDPRDFADDYGAVWNHSEELESSKWQLPNP